MNFLVVEFESTSEIGIIIKKWLLDKYNCYYPPYWKVKSKLEKALKQDEIPNKETLSVSRIRIFKEYETYGEARLGAKKAEETSELTSDDEDLGRGQRILKNRKSRISVSDEEDVNDIAASKHQIGSLKLNEIPKLRAIRTDGIQNVNSTSNNFETFEEQEIFEIEKEVPSTSAKTLSKTNTIEYEINSPLSARSERPSKSDRDRSTLELIMRKLDIIKAQSDQHGEMLQILLNRETTSIQAAPSDFEDILPISTMENFDIVESKIINDEKFKKDLAKKLTSVGGSGCNETTYRIMREVLTMELAVKFSFAGQRSKRTFNSLGLFKVICSAVKLNPLAKSPTDKEIEGAIKYWFARAPQKLLQRQKITTNSANNQEEERSE